ncbi:MAG: hypothetical protein ACLUD2_09195 [Clostridium sp.]
MALDHSGVFHVMGVVRSYFQVLATWCRLTSQVIEQVIQCIIGVAASFTFMHWRFANRETPAA